jgi:uncharacterized small protein (DUF1192 family)
MTKMKNVFVETVLEDLNKTEAQKQREAVETFVEYSAIECEQQIGMLEAEIKKLKLNLNRKTREVTAAEKNVRKATFSIADNFAKYVHTRNLAKQALSTLNREAAIYNVEIGVKEAELAEYNELLSIFKTEI